ncbi:MAG: VWA domain-containing protein [Acidimicrobiales bacterium]
MQAGEVTEGQQLTRPGGVVSARPLYFFWLADCSGSMVRDGRIQALNNAAAEALPHMRRVAKDNPNVEVIVRVLRFSTGAEWVGDAGAPLDHFVWPQLQAGGVTDLGAAIRLLTGELQTPPMPQRALSPVVVLLSDGRPTDDYEIALRDLLRLPWGQHAVRLAVAIGRDADRDVLRQFIADPTVAPLEANSPEALARQMRWVSTVALDAASSPRVGMVTGSERVRSIPEPLMSQSYPSAGPEIWFDDEPAG